MVNIIILLKIENLQEMIIDDKLLKNEYENAYYQKNINDDMGNQNIEHKNNDNMLDLVLKISGFWESKDEFGLTFRVIAVLPIS